MTPHPDQPDPHTTIHPPAGSHHVAEAPPMHDAPDEWHDHTRDEQPQHAHADVQNSNLVMGVGIALFLVISVSVLVVYGFYTHYNTQRSDIREFVKTGKAPSPADDIRAEKDKALGEVRAGTSFTIPTEIEGMEKPVTLAPISTAAQTIAHKYASQFSTPSTK